MRSSLRAFSIVPPILGLEAVAPSKFKFVIGFWGDSAVCIWVYLGDQYAILGDQDAMTRMKWCEKFFQVIKMQCVE